MGIINPVEQAGHAICNASGLISGYIMDIFYIIRFSMEKLIFNRALIT
jgi:hypothetical protein